MRTIRTKVYKFNELSEDAQQRAIDQWRNNGNVDTSYLYDEAHNTVKKFHDIFGTQEGRRSWLDVSCDQIDNNILELKGLRLRTYIINNFWQYLFKGKYYNSWSTKERVKHRKVTSTRKTKANGWNVEPKHGEAEYWNVYYGLTPDNSCVLTGVCWDMDLLQPIYEFLEWKLRPDYNSYMDFETLMNDCFHSLGKSLESANDYANSDEGIREDLQNSDNEFTQDGLIFNY